MSKVIVESPTIERWQPDFRYRKDKKVNVNLGGFNSTEKSLTDKEAFRVSLASLRGTLSAQGLGSPTVGSYSIKAGESYNDDFDFSYLNRPDITLVDLHEFIETTKKNLEQYDSDLQIRIRSELKEAEAKAHEMEMAELLKSEKKAD